jgi:hypothetical protein
MYSQRLIIIFSFILIINPSLIFILKNLHYYPIFDLINPFILSFIIYLLLSTFFLFYKKNVEYLNILKLIIFLSLLWSLQFYYLDISNLIGFEKNIHFYPKLILVLIILILSILISLYINRLFIIFFINLNLLLLVFTFIDTFNYNFLDSKKEEKFYVSQYFDLKDYKKPAEVNRRNMYFILMDEMASAKIYKDLGFDINNKINKFEKLGYQHLKKSKSSYVSTQYTIGSIFNMEYYLENIFIKEEYFYPFNIYGKEKPNLLKILDFYDYKFWFLDNQYSKCKNNYIVKCINNDNFINTLLYDESLNVFLERSFLRSIIYKIKFRFSPYKTKKTEIQKFIEFMDLNKDTIKNEANFFLIHNMNPHPPYRDENCNLINKTDKNIDINYINSTKCSLNLIDKVITKINNVDPNAIVVIQADHGYTRYDSKKDSRRFEIFNLVKVSSECNNNITQYSGTVSTINHIFKCFRYKKNISYENKNFVVKERNQKGTVFKYFN